MTTGRITSALAFFDGFIATAELFGTAHDVPGEMPGVTTAKEARAAVAELIEADKEYDAALEAVNMLHHRAAGDHVGFLNHKIGTESRLKAAKERRAAALARVQGGG